MQIELKSAALPLRLHLHLCSMHTLSRLLCPMPLNHLDITAGVPLFELNQGSSLDRLQSCMFQRLLHLNRFSELRGISTRL
jgi:hypothetical protein